MNANGKDIETDMGGKGEKGKQVKGGGRKGEMRLLIQQIRKGGRGGGEVRDVE